MIAEGRGRVRLRKMAGYFWLAAWIVVLYVVAAPWRHLGGLVDERLRWLEWFVLVTALPIGFTAGRFARDAAEHDGRRTHSRLLRLVLYPPAILTAAVLIALTAIGERGSIGVVATAFLSYWAGLDIAFGAVPLMEGKSYRFDRALEAEPVVAERAPASREMAWVPPWERV